MKATLKDFAAYPNKNGKKTVACTATLDDGTNTRIHMSLEGGALAVTKDVLEQLGRKPGQPLTGFTAQAEVLPETDPVVGGDQWRIVTTPPSDPAVEALLG